MKPTKTVVYALACIQELAKKFGDFVQVSEIALARNIPSAYCQKILLSLVRAGILLSVKGRGYRLLLAPGEISTLKVLDAISESPFSDFGADDRMLNDLSMTFATKVNHSLANLSVADLLGAAAGAR